jgi:hypothetical protein
MKKTLLLISLTFVSISAEAKKFVIFTDQKDGAKAEEVKQEFLKTYPFSTYKIEFEIVVLDPSELDCKSMHNIERNLGCDNSEKLQERAIAMGGEQAMIIKDVDKHGGSGGGVPVVTTKSPPNLMLHEYLHTLGLCDEYEYKKGEAGNYCQERLTAPNMVILELERYYASDSFARRTHMWDIPWFKKIENRTPITNSGGKQIGTGSVDSQAKAGTNYSDVPSALSEPIGLYEGKTCRQYGNSVRTWQPGGTATIMDVLDAGLGGPLEIVVDDILKSRGFKKKLDNTPDAPKKRLKPVVGEELATQQYGEGVVSQASKEPTFVDDTSRSNEKSLFDWLSNLFRSIGDAISR